MPAAAVMESFGARAMLDLVERERCTHAFMVPTQLTMVLADPSEAYWPK
jgi:hypothetical protein